MAPHSQSRDRSAADRVADSTRIAVACAHRYSRIFEASRKPPLSGMPTPIKTTARSSHPRARASASSIDPAPISFSPSGARISSKERSCAGRSSTSRIPTASASLTVPPPSGSGRHSREGKDQQQAINPPAPRPRGNGRTIDRHGRRRNCDITADGGSGGRRRRAVMSDARRGGGRRGGRYRVRDDRSDRIGGRHGLFLRPAASFAMTVFVRGAARGCGRSPATHVAPTGKLSVRPSIRTIIIFKMDHIRLLRARQNSKERSATRRIDDSVPIISNTAYPFRVILNNHAKSALEPILFAEGSRSAVLLPVREEDTSRRCGPPGRREGSRERAVSPGPCPGKTPAFAFAMLPPQDEERPVWSWHVRSPISGPVSRLGATAAVPSGWY